MVEVSHQLAASGIRHAALDTDELDRVWPRPADGGGSLSLRNLEHFVNEIRADGYDKLICVGVFIDAPDLSLSSIIDASSETGVRLSASDAVLERRIRERELGSGLEGQLKRSMKWANHLRSRVDTIPTVDTDDKTIEELAEKLLRLARWI